MYRNSAHVYEAYHREHKNIAHGQTCGFNRIEIHFRYYEGTLFSSTSKKLFIAFFPKLSKSGLQSYFISSEYNMLVY